MMFILSCCRTLLTEFRTADDFRRICHHAAKPEDAWSQGRQSDGNLALPYTFQGLGTVSKRLFALAVLLNSISCVK